MRLLRIACWPRFVAWLLVAWSLAGGVGCAPLLGPNLPTGRILPRVRSISDSSQDFALYLPRGFTPKRRWPVVFGFSPEGRGSDVVELMHEAAERHGYVILASNQAKNGPFPPIERAMEAMWNDAQKALSPHPFRFYSTGFSGGARMAVHLAQRHVVSFAGVIPIGAFLPVGERVPPGARLQIYLVVGELDFNFGEVHRETRAIKERLYIDEHHEGHRWASPEEYERALTWMDGTEEARRRFVADRMAHAAEEEKNGQVPMALAIYDRLAAFDEGARAAAARLHAQPSTDQLLESSTLLDELTVTDPKGAQIALAEAERLAAVDGPLAARARSNLSRFPFYGSREAAERASAGDLARAKEWLALTDQTLANRPIFRPAEVHYQRARALALLGDADRALDALAKAVDNGFDDGQQLALDPALQSLLGMPRLGVILGRLRR